MSSDALNALGRLSAGDVSLVLLAVDASNETIELASARTISLSELSGAFPKDEPRFGLVSFPHAGGQTVVFVYSCPNEARVKLKMLYSTVKSAVVTQAEARGLKLEKRVEVQAAEDANEATIAREFAPASDDSKKSAATFDKPARPGRGAARLIRK